MAVLLEGAVAVVARLRCAALCCLACLKTVLRQPIGRLTGAKFIVAGVVELDQRVFVGQMEQKFQDLKSSITRQQDLEARNSAP